MVSAGLPCLPPPPPTATRDPCVSLARDGALPGARLQGCCRPSTRRSAQRGPGHQLGMGPGGCKQQPGQKSHQEPRASQLKALLRLTWVFTKISLSVPKTAFLLLQSLRAETGFQSHSLGIRCPSPRCSGEKDFLSLPSRVLRNPCPGLAAGSELRAQSPPMFPAGRGRAGCPPVSALPAPLPLLTTARAEHCRPLSSGAPITSCHLNALFFLGTLIRPHSPKKTTASWGP